MASSGNPIQTFGVARKGPKYTTPKKYSTFKRGPNRRPETSVQDYHSTLRNIPDERRSHEHRGGSLKSLMFYLTTLSIAKIICGMTLTGEYSGTSIKTCNNVTLSITNSTWTALGQNPALQGDRVKCNHDTLLYTLQ
jgi:hypothetical protein